MSQKCSVPRPAQHMAGSLGASAESCHTAHPPHWHRPDHVPLSFSRGESFDEKDGDLLWAHRGLGRKAEQDPILRLKQARDLKQRSSRDRAVHAAAQHRSSLLANFCLNSSGDKELTISKY